MHIEVVRRYDAPPAHVYGALLDPDRVGRFMFRTPAGVLKRCDVDPRVGGGFTIVETRGGDDAEHFGTYVALEPGRRVAFDFRASEDEPPSRVTIDLATDGAGCVATLSQDLAPEWIAYAEATKRGWTMILDHLSGVL